MCHLSADYRGLASELCNFWDLLCICLGISNVVTLFETKICLLFLRALIMQNLSICCSQNYGFFTLHAYNNNNLHNHCDTQTWPYGFGNLLVTPNSHFCICYCYGSSSVIIKCNHNKDVDLWRWCKLFTSQHSNTLYMKMWDNCWTLSEPEEVSCIHRTKISDI